MTFSNLSAANQTYDCLDARYHKYGWNPYMWQQCVLCGNHQKYKNFILERHAFSEQSAKDTVGPGLAQAIHYKNVLRTAQFVFPGNVITLRQIGPASPGYPVHTDRTSWRINQLDAPLKDGIVVDVLSCQQKPSGFLPLPPRSEITADWPLASYDDTRDIVSVLPRSDISVWLVDDGETLKKVLGQGPARDSELKIEVRDTTQHLLLTAKRIQAYSRIPISELTKNAFFIISSQFPI